MSDTEEFPCRTNHSDCIQNLTQRAIAHSNELQVLGEKITLINQRLEVIDERINYAQSRRWVNYITLDPLRLIQNIAGGVMCSEIE